MRNNWGRYFFRAGAVVLILLAMAHSLSFFGQPVAANDTERQLQNLMQTYRFNLAGSMRTMDELLRGFSICFMVGALGLGVLDLALASERVEMIKRLALINALWLAVLTAISLRFFFVIPTVFLGVALLLFVFSWILLSRAAS